MGQACCRGSAKSTPQEPYDDPEQIYEKETANGEQDMPLTDDVFKTVESDYTNEFTDGDGDDMDDAEQLDFISMSFRDMCEGKYGIIANAMPNVTLCADLQRELFSYGFSRVLSLPLPEVSKHIDHFQQTYYLQSTYDVVVLLEEEYDDVTSMHFDLRDRLLKSCDSRSQAASRASARAEPQFVVTGPHEPDNELAAADQALDTPDPTPAVMSPTNAGDAEDSPLPPLSTKGSASRPLPEMPQLQVRGLQDEPSNNSASITGGRSRRQSVSTRQTNKVTRGRAMSGAKMLNEYVVLEKLGKGAYGKVRKVENKDTGAVFAMKIVNKEALKKRRKMGGGNAFQDVQREIAIWQKLDHDYCVRLHEVIDDPEAEELYMVTDFMSGGPIAKVQNDGTVAGGALPEITVCNMMRDILLGLEYLHANDVVHRDIKPENLLFDSQNHVRLVDFGVSHICDGGDDRVSQSYGTPAFMAPEACKGGVYQGKPTDIFALGVTLYALVAGRMPFYANNTLGIYKSIMHDEPEFPEELSQELVDLLKRLLAKDPAERITIDEMKSHPWITQGGLWKAPSLDEHSGTLVSVTDEDIANAVQKRGVVLLDRFGTIMKAISHFRRRARSARGRKNSVGSNRRTSTASSGDDGEVTNRSRANSVGGADAVPAPATVSTPSGVSALDVSTAFARSILHVILVTPMGIRRPFWKRTLCGEWHAKYIGTCGSSEGSHGSLNSVSCSNDDPSSYGSVAPPGMVSGGESAIDLSEMLTVVGFDLMEHYSFDRREFCSCVRTALMSRKRISVGAHTSVATPKHHHADSGHSHYSDSDVNSLASSFVHEETDGATEDDDHFR
jgi:[calcium/calmodulin-dependent protein kinase] kinase